MSHSSAVHAAILCLYFASGVITGLMLAAVL